MELKDILSIIISVLALLLSLYTFCLNHSPANLNAFIGEKFTFSIHNDLFSIGLPIVFSNKGNSPGVIYSSSIELKQCDPPFDSYILTFYRILETENANDATLVPVDLDNPIVIDKNSHATYYLAYSLGEYNTNIIPEPGKYILTLNLWSTPFSSNNPDITRSISFDFTENSYNFLLKHDFMTIKNGNHPLKIPGKITK